ncbi:hypothetical protein DAMA08_013610 [Martiniozyma asiatica (nom. inval.)]|nr:hypothetical protein DAMA08_013610 [Martiniozyma asiatica]
MNKEAMFDQAKEAAIKFYDQEHLLDQEERKQLYVFFEQQWRRMLLLSSVGCAAGVALPFLIYKVKGMKKMMSPLYPVAGGFIGSSFAPSLFTDSVYQNQLKSVIDRHGTESQIYKTIEATPDPIIKSFFWANYFKRSAENEGLRLKDPREITDMNTPMLINKPKGTEGVPEFGKPANMGDQQSAVSAWDQVRKGNVSYEAGPVSQAVGERIEADDPFDLEPRRDEKAKTIGDSYEIDEEATSSWDNVRKSNGV